MGICGGYQMLGDNSLRMKRVGAGYAVSQLLNTITALQYDVKTTTQVNATMSGELLRLTAAPRRGYRYAVMKFTWGNGAAGRMLYGDVAKMDVGGGMARSSLLRPRLAPPCFRSLSSMCYGREKGLRRGKRLLLCGLAKRGNLIRCWRKHAASWLILMKILQHAKHRSRYDDSVTGGARSGKSRRAETF